MLGLALIGQDLVTVVHQQPENGHLEQAPKHFTLRIRHPGAAGVADQEDGPRGADPVKPGLHQVVERSG